jgi:Zn-dependent peptidase ImmA (M78 family)/transcriptional regulator with XRE-family HTH domain
MSDYPTAKGLAVSQHTETLEVRLGRRLREARARLELTQGEVALRLSIPRQAVSEIENGRRAVSATELFAFSRLYAIPPDDLLGETEPHLEEELMFLRADLLSPEGNLALAQFQSLCREYRWIEELLDQIVEPELAALQSSVRSFEQAWRLARKEQQRLNLGATPAWSLLETLEERVGVKVLSLEADWSLSGACVLGSFGPSIFINALHPAPRRIFTLAHEYFHLSVAAHGRTMEPRAYACAGEPGKKTREDQLADQFAAELLMPNDSIEERLAHVVGSDEVPSGIQIIRLAILFGVSTQAMLFRLGNLNKLQKSTPTELYQDPDLRQEDRNSRSEGFEPPATPRRFETLAIQAFLADHISRAKLAELLRIALPEVEERVGPFRAGDALDQELRNAR